MSGTTTRPNTLQLVSAATGIVLGVLVRETLGNWAVEKFGYFEPDMIRVTLLVPPGLVAIGLALLGINFAGVPGTVARLAVLIGCLAVLALIATNLPSAVDGIAPRAVPLAIALAFSSAWMALACWIAVHR